MKLLIDIDEKQLHFINVPEIYENFRVVNYGFAGTYFLETDSKELNHWKINLPNNCGYQIIGFTKDCLVDEFETDKNFVLRKI